MHQTKPPPPAEPAQDDVDALEKAEGTGTGTADNVTDATADAAPGSPAAAAPPKSGGLKQTLRKFNIYLLFFVLILVVAAAIIVVAYFQSKKASTTSTL